MVKVIDEEIYKCPYCSSKYKDEDEAEDCRDECALKNALDVEITGKYFIACEMCHEKFKNEKDAETCEKEHFETEDKYYYWYNVELNKVLLEKAASHKDQKTLI